MAERRVIRAVLFLLLAYLLLALPATAARANCAEAACADNPDRIGISPEEIAAYPRPNVIQLAVDSALINDRRYQRARGPLDIYDAPYGNYLRTLDAGFNFLTTQGTEGEWTLINPGQWVLSSALTDVYPSQFSGVLLGESLPYTVAWVLGNTVPSRTPGADPIDGDLPVLRYQLINIYDTVEVDTWRWYQIGVDQWIEQRRVAKVLPVERPAEINTNRWVSVDLYEQVLIAYDGETPVFATLISSGLPQYSTREGIFNVYVRYPRTIMSGLAGRPEFYYLEEVPWTMYFDGDIGLHGTYWHNSFGYRHSRGCVNMSITDAHWLYHWAAVEFDFSTPNSTGMAVYVYSSGEYR